jgi:hypothetical protein
MGQQNHPKFQGMVITMISCLIRTWCFLARSQHTKGKGCIEKSKTSERSFSQRFTDVPPFLTFQTFWKRLFFYQACVPIATCAMVKHGLWGVVIPPSLGIL